jgi:hypothetical protein
MLLHNAHALIDEPISFVHLLTRHGCFLEL